jgi:hypothetical protein
VLKGILYLLDYIQTYLNVKLIYYKGCVTKTTTTPKCVLVHFKFHYILSEFDHFYHNKIGQPSNGWGPIVTNNELVH